MVSIIKVLKSYEKKNISLKSFFITLSSVIIVRFFLEKLLEPGHSFKVGNDFYANFIDFSHIYISWLVIFFSFIIISIIVLKINIRKSIKYILLVSPVILIVPLIDFFTIDSMRKISYNFNIFQIKSFLLILINPFKKINLVTPGVRVEIFIIVIFGFIVSYLIIKKNLIRSILFSITIYLNILFFGFLPVLYNIFGIDFFQVGENSITTYVFQQKFVYIYLYPLLIYIGMFILYLYFYNNKKYFKLFYESIFISRLSYYLFLLNFGILFSLYQTNQIHGIFNFFDISKIIFANLSIIWLFIFAKIENDINDQKIDKISNYNRVSLKGKFTKSFFVDYKNISLFVSFLFGFCVNEIFIVFLFFIGSLSYLYSNPPFRLRKYYPLNNFILTLIGGATYLSGVSLIFDYYAFEKLYPKSIFWLILLYFFILVNFKDFKDLKGDKKNNIQNLIQLFNGNKILGHILILFSSIVLFFIYKILKIHYYIYLTAGYLIIYNIYLCRIKNTKDISNIYFYILPYLIISGLIWIFL